MTEVGWTWMEVLLWIVTAAVLAFHLGWASHRRWGRDEPSTPRMPWAEEQCDGCGKGVVVYAPSATEAGDCAMDWLVSHEQHCSGRW